MLTGQIGKKGAGVHGWAGNYKAALFQGSKITGPGFKGWVAEDPFIPTPTARAHGRDVKVRMPIPRDEEPAYWNHGDRPLIVDTPKAGRRVFTGKTHMPTPTKALHFTNVNLFNNAKHAYDMFKNVNPGIEMIIAQDIVMTASVQYSDIGLPANSWVEFRDLEITASCSNPFLQIWKGGIEPGLRFQGRPDHPCPDRQGPRRGDRRASASSITSISSTRTNAASTSSGSSTPPRLPPVTSSTTSWPASTVPGAAP
jgi:nitrate reductase / nitrite oxidoreductase, alpha subunit